MSTNRKRSLTIAGHGTSISLEEPFWAALKEIAAADGRSLPDLVAEVDGARGPDNLSSALRLFVLDRHRRELAELREKQDPSSP